jgi:hypothetical protein
MMSDSLDLILSRHAQARMQQRGIPQTMIDQVLRHGCERHDHRGAIIVLLDREGRRRMARSGEARLGEIDRLGRVYVLLRADSTIVTVGHR